MSDNLLLAKRAAAADWYESHAAERDGTAIAVLWRHFAQRVRTGEADSFIDDLMDGMVDFDNDPSRR